MNAVDYAWRGFFESSEVNRLHAEAFDHRVFADEDWDWARQCAKHSMGWVTARAGGRLVGFLNVIWDGSVHAWIQDVMVLAVYRRQGIGLQLINAARQSAKDAGCEWLHVDFDDELRSFYFDAAGFKPTNGGLIRLE